LRAAVIKQLICQFELDIPVIEQQFKINFTSYFSEALLALEPLRADGLVSVSQDKITVTACGNLFIRIICMCFDAHLQQQIKQTRFSRVI